MRRIPRTPTTPPASGKRWGLRGRRSASPMNSPTERTRAQSRRMWNDVERNADDLAANYPDPNIIEGDATMGADILYGRAERRAEQGFVLGALGFDVSFIALAIRMMAYSLVHVYNETLEAFWLQGLMEMNHGQLSITFNHYLEEIKAHQEMALTEWPEVEPEDYVLAIMDAYDEDVWGRAFTDLTDAPVPTLQYLVNQAKAINSLADAIETSPFQFPMPRTGKFVQNTGTGQWLRVTGDPMEAFVSGPTL